MMRNNGLLKWTLHKNKNGSNGKNWIHPPEALSTGHIVYLVKFLGVTEVEQPKGMDIVKESIRKLKLDEEIRRAEGGKTPKAELTISMDGVAIQEPKGKKILHQFPLHQISYCADDKEEKRFFSFIAKEGEVHKCFVFASEKLAEEITLTIGQAFDLAYKRYLDSSGRELDLKKEIMNLQKRVAELETENSNLKEKLSLHSVDGQSNSSLSSAASTTGGDVLMCPPVPARASTNVANQLIAEFAMAASEIEKRAHGNGNGNGHGRHMDLFDDEFDSKPRGNPDGIEAPPRISPPPKGIKKPDSSSGTTMVANNNGFGSGSISGSSFGGSSTDVFGSDPFFTGNDTSAATMVTHSAVSSAISSDPFGMSSFGGNSSNNNGVSSSMENHQQMHANIMNGFSSNPSTMNFNNMTSTSPPSTTTKYSDFSNLFTASNLNQPSILDSKRLDSSSSHNNNVNTNGHTNNNAKNVDMSSLDMLDPFRMT